MLAHVQYICIVRFAQKRPKGRKKAKREEREKRRLEKERAKDQAESKKKNLVETTKRRIYRSIVFLYDSPFAKQASIRKTNP